MHQVTQHAAQGHICESHAQAHQAKKIKQHTPQHISKISNIQEASFHRSATYMETKPRLAIYYHVKPIISQHSDSPMICHKLFEQKPLVNIICQTLINMPFASNRSWWYACNSKLDYHVFASNMSGWYACNSNLYFAQASTIKTCV